MSKKNHVLITGTGRAGTTFLVELFTSLGLDTGFSLDDVIKYKNKRSNAGLELDLRSGECPYIVKDPWFCDYANDSDLQARVALDHVFIPVRDLNAAAESRRRVTKIGIAESSLLDRIKARIGVKKAYAGGLWHTKSLKKNEQEQVLLLQIYKLLLALSHYDTRVTIIRYPRLADDAHYLYNKLLPVIQHLSYEQFEAVYNATVNKELVHSFNAKDT